MSGGDERPHVQIGLDAAADLERAHARREARCPALHANAVLRATGGTHQPRYGEIL